MCVTPRDNCHNPAVTVTMILCRDRSSCGISPDLIGTVPHSQGVGKVAAAGQRVAVAGAKYPVPCLQDWTIPLEWIKAQIVTASRVFLASQGTVG